MYGHPLSQKFCSWSAEQEKIFSSLSPFAPENLVSRRVRPSRPASACSIPHTQAESGAYRISPDFRGGVHLFIPPTAIGSVPSLLGHAIAYRRRSQLRVRRHRASSQANSSNGCCLFRDQHGSINVRLSFPTPTIGMKWLYATQSIGGCVD